MVYDDDALYIGVWCFDTEAGRIVTHNMGAVVICVMKMWLTSRWTHFGSTKRILLFHQFNWCSRRRLH